MLLTPLAASQPPPTPQLLLTDTCNSAHPEFIQSLKHDMFPYLFIADQNSRDYSLKASNQ